MPSICRDCDGKIKIRADGTLCIRDACGHPCPACTDCDCCPASYRLEINGGNDGDCSCLNGAELIISQVGEGCLWTATEQGMDVCLGTGLETGSATLSCNASTCKWELSIQIGTFGADPYAQITIEAEQDYCGCPQEGSWEVTFQDIETEVGQPEADCDGTVFTVDLTINSL